MNNDQRIRLLLEGLFEKLGAGTLGQNYGILLDAQNAIEEIVSDENEDLKEQLEEYESKDYCNCSCDKCAKCEYN